MPSLLRQAPVSTVERPVDGSPLEHREVTIRAHDFMPIGYTCLLPVRRCVLILRPQGVTLTLPVVLRPTHILRKKRRLMLQPPTPVLLRSRPPERHRELRCPPPGPQSRSRCSRRGRRLPRTRPRSLDSLRLRAPCRLPWRSRGHGGGVGKRERTGYTMQALVGELQEGHTKWHFRMGWTSTSGGKVWVFLILVPTCEEYADVVSFCFRSSITQETSTEDLARLAPCTV